MACCDVATDQGRARARIVLADLNRIILSRAGSRRQGVGFGSGARAPVGLAQPRRRLEVLTDPRIVVDPAAPEGVRAVRQAVTPLGYKTAVRALPPLLAGLEDRDPRRRAALLLADAVERIGSIKGGDLAGGDIKGGISDGGVTTRIKHAARLRMIEALANGWAVDQRHGGIVRGPEFVVMRVIRQRGAAQDIKAMRLLELLCIEGADMREILERHGWSAHSKHRKALGAAALVILDDVAQGLGI